VIHRMMIEALAAVLVSFSQLQLAQLSSSRRQPVLTSSFELLALVFSFRQQLSSPWLSDLRASCTSCRQKAGSDKDRKDRMGQP